MASSSEAEPSTKGIDASVGGLVWVRRRNGSWWPGRIMGLDEFSDGCLVSPRSGTPVKLLGREDASVDWYNLEKSKRVKAFRCGEYDECIRKAKIAAANSNKKQVKYARREDAIIHALEIESARLGVDRPDFCYKIENSGDDREYSARESPSELHSNEESENVTDVDSESEENSNSGPELSQSGISFEEPIRVIVPKVQLVQGRRRKNPNDSEDDGIEGTKRMRGLEDLGTSLGSKRKTQPGGVAEVVRQNSSLPCDSNTAACNGIPSNGHQVYTSLRRKRSQMPNLNEILKRKNRRRPLTKVLESTAVVSVPLICEQPTILNDSSLPEPSDRKVSGLDSNELNENYVVNINNSDNALVSLEDRVMLNGSQHACDTSQTHTKKSANELSIESGLEAADFSDRLFDVPLVREVKNSAGVSPLLVSSPSGKAQVGALGSLCSQSSQSEAAMPSPNKGHNEVGRTISGVTHSNISRRIEQGTSKWQSKGKRNSRCTNKKGKQSLRQYMDMDGEPSARLIRMEPLDGFSHGSDQKGDCIGIMGNIGSFSYPSQGKSQLVTTNYLDDIRDWGKTISTREPNTKPVSTEVKLQTDTTVAPHRSLPFRQPSFTAPSRYQMQASPFRNSFSDSQLYDVDLEVKASYRPQHVPLVSLMSKLNGKAIVGHPLAVEVLDAGSCDLLLKPISEAGRVTTKKLILKPRLSPSKQPKMRKCEKIRKLSSLTGSRQRSEEERKTVVGRFRGPAIACIPLKLVFSRINEALNGLSRPTLHSTSSNS